MSPAAEPLRTVRLATLGLAWCFAVISASVGLNGLIKSKQQKSDLKKLVTSPTTVDIDTDDIFDAGVSATAASLLLAILLFKSVIAMLLPATKALAARTLRIQAALLVFGSIWLFASMIPYLDFFVNRQAKVEAFIGTTQLPDSIVQAVEAASGNTGVYKKISYLKLVAILPWFALLFTLIAAAVLFVAGGKTTTESTQTPPHVQSSPAASMVKEDASHNEKVEEV